MSRCGNWEDEEEDDGGTSAAPEVALGLVLLGLAVFFMLPASPNKTEDAKPTHTVALVRQEPSVAPANPPPVPVKPATEPASQPIQPSKAASLLTKSPVTITRVTPITTAGTALATECDAYDALISDVLTRLWKPSRGGIGTARLRLTIEPSGQVLRAKNVQSSEHSLLESSVQSMLLDLDTIGKPLPTLVTTGEYVVDVEIRAE